MKPFDLELAKAGHPVCTRDGRPVRVICFDLKAENDRNILALIDGGPYETIVCYHRNGHLLSYNTPDANDLMMVTTKHEGWINIKKIDSDDDHVPYVEGVFATKQKAEDMIRAGRSYENHIATIKIEWEE